MTSTADMTRTDPLALADARNEARRWHRAFGAMSLCSLALAFACVVLAGQRDGAIDALDRMTMKAIDFADVAVDSTTWAIDERDARRAVEADFARLQEKVDRGVMMDLSVAEAADRAEIGHEGPACTLTTQWGSRPIYSVCVKVVAP